MRLSLIVYDNLMGQKRKDITACEVGVYKGDNGIEMLTYDKIKKLYLVDNYKPFYKWFTDSVGVMFFDDTAEMFYEVVKERFFKYDGRVDLIKKDSVEAAKDFPDEFFDYVYIDGGHDYEMVRDDIKAWFPKVKKSGMLAGHDINADDVRKAVIEFAVMNKILTFCVNIIAFELIPADFNDLHDWWIFKT
jgi:hypothetical protein